MPRVISSKLLQDWTPAEAERLLQLSKRRASAARAAQLLGRRIGSVRRQAKLSELLQMFPNGNSEMIRASDSSVQAF
jgi:hypothetical protein